MAQASGEMWEAQFLVLLLLQMQRVAPGKMGLSLWEPCPPDTRVGGGGGQQGCLDLMDAKVLSLEGFF